MKQISKILLFLLLLFLPIYSEARTITVVYDDSKSMSGQEKWAYANYAMQSLSALLADEDDLAVIRMSSFDRVEKIAINSAVSRNKSISQIRNSWREGESTPFEAVVSALQYSSNKVEQRKKNLKPGHADDWLIIMTDGEFQNSPIEPERLFKSFLDSVGGKVRTIFFLIGSSAEKNIPRAWNKIAPIDIFSAPANGEDIAEVMFQIAALVTGRDRQGVIVSGGTDERHYRFESPFPIKRLTIFQQSKHTNLSRIRNISCDSCQGVTAVKEFDIRTPRELKNQAVFGRIGKAGGKNIFPPGTFTIEAEKVLDLNSTVVLVEAAVDFAVDIQDAAGKLLKKDKNGTYRVCKDKDLRITTHFLEAGTNTIIPISSIGSKLEAKAIVGQKEYFLQPSISSDILESQLFVPGKPKSVSVEVRYPGYFHLKSNIFSIKPEACNLIMDASVEKKSNIKIPYTLSNSPETVDSFDLNIEGEGPDGTYNLVMKEVPSGITLKVKGKELSGNGDSIAIDVKGGKSNPIKIMRDHRYREELPKQIILQVSSDDKRITWSNNLIKVIIEPRPRNLTVDGEDTWTSAVDELDDARPLSLALNADGQFIDQEELKLWKIEWQKEDMGFQVKRDPVQGVFLVKPAPLLGLACFASTGEIPVEFIMLGPFPGERISHTVLFSVKDVPWWQKCLSLIISILFFMFFVWWLIGFIKKPRFCKESMIVFQRKVDRTKGTEWPYNLPVNFFSRWIVPYKAEKKTVESITFVAGESSAYILIPGDLQEKNMTVNGILPSDPGEGFWSLGNNESLEIRNQNKVDRYTYRSR